MRALDTRLVEIKRQAASVAEYERVWRTFTKIADRPMLDKKGGLMS